MKVSDNMNIVKNASDEHFLVWLNYLRPNNIERWEFKILNTMIQNRIDRMGYTFEWGCCGSNQIRKKK